MCRDETCTPQRAPGLKCFRQRPRGQVVETHEVGNVFANFNTQQRTYLQ